MWIGVHGGHKNGAIHNASFEYSGDHGLDWTASRQMSSCGVLTLLMSVDGTMLSLGVHLAWHIQDSFPGLLLQKDERVHDN